MTFLHYDYETRSETDLERHGLDRYLRDPSTRVLLCAYAFDDGKVQLWEPHREKTPSDLGDALHDPFVTKVAWNSQFERGVSKFVLGIDIPSSEFLDPMVWARHMSMPGKLAEVGKILGLRQDEQKIARGQELLKFFCEPARDGGVETLFGVEKAVWRDWSTHPAEWEEFRGYCTTDVIAERACLKKMRAFPLPRIEQAGWVLDQKVNERGMPTDMFLVNGAASIAEREKEDLRREIKDITGVENPNANPQVLAWAQTQGYTFSGLGKPFVTRALAGECELTEDCKTILMIRKQSAKTSDSKFEAIRDMVAPDGRLRYQFNYLGAARAGRWTGGGVQLQNLPRPTKDVERDLELACQLLREGDLLGVRKSFKNVMDVVSSCVRSAFRAPEGKVFVVCDLNAIENRVLGWLSGCQKILQVFREGRCPYLSFASAMYRVPYEKLVRITPEGVHKAIDEAAARMRQDAKPAVLGAGYRLGGGDEVETEDGDRVRTGLWGYAQNLGVEMSRELAHDSVRIWREEHPEVVQCWYDYENAAFETFRRGGVVDVGPVSFECHKKKILVVHLPSGRSLHYIRPRVEKFEFFGKMKDTLTYEGVDQVTKQWTRIKTHGGKLMENIDQGVSRDLLLHGMMLADDRGFEIVGHCHDEQITLVDEGSSLGLDELRVCMTTPPDWAKDLPLGAEGYVSEIYKKG